MNDDENRETRRRSVWLPATVLFVLSSLVSGAVYWLTLPLKEVVEDQARPKHHVSEKVKPASTPPAKSAEINPKDLVPPSQVRSQSSPESSQKKVKKEGKSPAKVTKMAATKIMAAPTTLPVEKLASPEPVKTAPPAAVVVPAAPVPVSPIAAPAGHERTAAIPPPGGRTIPKLPPALRSVPLPRAPDPALVENSQKGPLPVVGSDGREAWRVYARPFDRLKKRPRISVVLYGLGTSGAATRSAIQGLPGAITLAFSPYAKRLDNWIADARAAGHEILLMVPMEPKNYPDYDLGPRALLTSLTGPENTKRLEWILSRGVGYVGITDFMGSRFTNSTQHMRVLFRNLKKRGLMFLESRVSSRAISGALAAASRVPYASSALYIDSQASRPAIDGQLAETERLAKKLGAVVVMGFLYPVTLERIAKWAVTIEKRGFALAPVSAIPKRRN